MNVSQAGEAGFGLGCRNRQSVKTHLDGGYRGLTRFAGLFDGATGASRKRTIRPWDLGTTRR